ncbi:MAG: hypothetical protein JL57_05555 [Desulfosporosinus sp. BICA1-9]|nr:MAG: hypothetical protein JL57_05555 [Desulfosporosinus sp. BICA1-9]
MIKTYTKQDLILRDASKKNRLAEVCDKLKLFLYCFRVLDEKECFLLSMQFMRTIIYKPARTCVAVRQLPLGILCEIEAVVYLK